MSRIVLYFGTRYDYWPSAFVNVKKTDVIRCRLLYCTLVPGKMSMCLILYEISSFVYFNVTLDLHLWPSVFVKITGTLTIRCIFCCWMFLPKKKFVGSVEFEIWTIVWRKLKWRNPWCHRDVIIHFVIFMKFNYKSAKGIFKRHAIFQFDGHKRAELYIRDVNREMRRKNGY